jgi:hypothetical protein
MYAAQEHIHVNWSYDTIALLLFQDERNRDGKDRRDDIK